MDAEQLRALQAPLKDAYRHDGGKARVTSRAEARLEDGAVACRVATSGGEVRAGLHPATGGDGAEACSADMLLEALAACAGVTLRAVATASGVRVSGRVVAEGVWDARGTLGVDKSVPVALTDISLSFELQSDATDEKLERVIAAAERYCVILQTLRAPPRITLRRSVTRAAA